MNGGANVESHDKDGLTGKCFCFVFYSIRILVSDNRVLIKITYSIVKKKPIRLYKLQYIL